MANKPWFDVLLAARRIQGRGEVITSQSLAGEAKVTTAIASAWLFKFMKYGYVLKGDKYIAGRRWSWSWGLTRWGLRFREKRRSSGLRLVANPGPDGKPGKKK